MEFQKDELNEILNIFQQESSEIISAMDEKRQNHLFLHFGTATASPLPHPLSQRIKTMATHPLGLANVAFALGLALLYPPYYRGAFGCGKRWLPCLPFGRTLFPYSQKNRKRRII